MRRDLLAAIASGRRRFSPLDLAPALWLRGDLWVTLNAGNVSAWADQSGNARSFEQTTPASRPIYLATGGPNGTPCVEVGTDRFLSSVGAASLWGFLHRSAALTFWAVVRTVDADPTAVNAVSITAILASASSPATGPGVGFFTEDRTSVITGGDGIRLVSYTTSVTQYDARSSTGALPGATWRAAEFNYIPATGVFLRSNGADAGFALGPYTPQAADPPGATIGRLLAAPAAGTRIRIAEMGALVNPTSDQLTLLRAYLTRRYGVAA